MSAPSVPVTPFVGSHVYEGSVDGSRLLFNSRDRRLHVLNPSAAAVWDRLAHPTTVATLVADVAAAFAVEPASIRFDVERTLDQFVADGLTTDAAPPPRPVAAPVARPRGPGVGSVVGLGTTIDVLVADVEAAATLTGVLAPLRAGPDAVGSAWIALDEDDGAWTLTSSAGTVARTGSRLAGALRVISEINHLAVTGRPHDLVLHAGAVARDGRAVVLPGSSNRGKSTLTTALVGAGYAYLTDEAAAIRAGGVVAPYPKAIALDPGSFPLFPDLAPTDGRNGLAAALAGREWHVDPSRVGAIAGTRPVRVVVCPRWRAGSSTRLHRLAPAEALHVLLGETFDFGGAAPVVFPRLARLVETVPVYRLGYGDLDRAVATVRALLVDPESA